MEGWYNRKAAQRKDGSKSVGLLSPPILRSRDLDSRDTTTLSLSLSLSDFSSSAFLPALRSTARVLAMNACLREVAVGGFEPQVLELCIGKSLMSEKTI